jgi:hypothetical protein
MISPRMIGPIAPGCELLKELVLGTAPIAVLAKRDDLSGQLELRALQPIWCQLGQQVKILNASSEREIDATFTTIRLKSPA